MPIDDWKSQMKRGTLEYCVLLMIAKQSRYGYEIISLLERRPVLAAKESTVYPLLRRLLREGYLSSTWKESAEGLPPRKYYTLTAQGKAYLAELNGAWAELLSALEEIKEA